MVILLILVSIFSICYKYWELHLQHHIIYFKSSSTWNLLKNPSITILNIKENSKECSSINQILSLLLIDHQFKDHKPQDH
jgi:hypothetical protein